MSRPVCPVRANCRTPRHCPYCVDGSEYTPRDRRIAFPTVVARRQARRVARQAPAAVRGRQARQHGLRAERMAARSFSGTVVPGSGQYDGLPNDVVLAGLGWRVETKWRRQGFRLLARWLAASPGLLCWTEPDGVVLYALARPVFLTGWHTDPVVKQRPGGFPGLRRWLAAESADALLLSGPGDGWIIVMDARHFAAWIQHYNEGQATTWVQ